MAFRLHNLFNVSALCFAIASTAIFFGSSISPVRAAEKSYSVDRLKAAYIYNFSKYVKWPNHYERFYICFTGVGESIEIYESVDGLAVGSKTVRVKSFDPIPSLEEALDCHIIYFGVEAAAEQEELVKHLLEKPVLTVTEKAGLGIVTMYIENEKVRFEIYPKRVHLAGLKVSNRLLALARIRDED